MRLRCFGPAADILYVTASTSDITFKAAMDRQALRLMSVDMPATWSFGDVLTSLGVSGAASLGDVVSVSATTLVYVPGVNGTGTGQEGRGGRHTTLCVAARSCTLHAVVAVGMCLAAHSRQAPQGVWQVLRDCQQRCWLMLVVWLLSRLSVVCRRG